MPIDGDKPPNQRNGLRMLVLLLGMFLVLALCVRFGCEPPARHRIAPTTDH